VLLEIGYGLLHGFGLTVEEQQRVIKA